MPLPIEDIQSIEKKIDQFLIKYQIGEECRRAFLERAIELFGNIKRGAYRSTRRPIDENQRIIFFNEVESMLVKQKDEIILKVEAKKSRRVLRPGMSDPQQKNQLIQDILERDKDNTYNAEELCAFDIDYLQKFLAILLEGESATAEENLLPSLDEERNALIKKILLHPNYLNPHRGEELKEFDLTTLEVVLASLDQSQPKSEYQGFLDVCNEQLTNTICFMSESYPTLSTDIAKEVDLVVESFSEKIQELVQKPHSRFNPYWALVSFDELGIELDALVSGFINDINRISNSSKVNVQDRETLTRLTQTTTRTHTKYQSTNTEQNIEKVNEVEEVFNQFSSAFKQSGFALIGACRSAIAAIKVESDAALKNAINTNVSDENINQYKEEVSKFIVSLNKKLSEYESYAKETMQQIESIFKVANSSEELKSEELKLVYKEIWDEFTKVRDALKKDFLVNPPSQDILQPAQALINSVPVATRTLQSGNLFKAPELSTLNPCEGTAEETDSDSESNVDADFNAADFEAADSDSAAGFNPYPYSQTFGDRLCLFLGIDQPQQLVNAAKAKANAAKANAAKVNTVHVADSNPNPPLGDRFRLFLGIGTNPQQPADAVDTDTDTDTDADSNPNPVADSNPPTLGDRFRLLLGSNQPRQPARVDRQHHAQRFLDETGQSRNSINNGL